MFIKRTNGRMVDTEKLISFVKELIRFAKNFIKFTNGIIKSANGIILFSNHIMDYSNHMIGISCLFGFYGKPEAERGIKTDKEYGCGLQLVLCFCTTSPPKLFF